MGGLGDRQIGWDLGGRGKSQIRTWMFMAFLLASSWLPADTERKSMESDETMTVSKRTDRQRGRGNQGKEEMEMEMDTYLWGAGGRARRRGLSH